MSSTNADRGLRRWIDQPEVRSLALTAVLGAVGTVLATRTKAATSTKPAPRTRGPLTAPHDVIGHRRQLPGGNGSTWVKPHSRGPGRSGSA